MSTVKSFSVGDGDMFYIDHNSDNFSIIDCCLWGENAEAILSEIGDRAGKKGICRFISTHPDNDHIAGLTDLHAALPIINFYVVKNTATKLERTADFDQYCTLRDSSSAFYLSAGCERRWMNQANEERGSAGIDILWPVLENSFYKEALTQAKLGKRYNNLSPIFQYHATDGVSILWFGDLESDFMDCIADEVTLPKAAVVFAPHHGRNTGKLPREWLEQINPQLIIVGEAPSKYLNYYPDYNTITQNSAGDITLDIRGAKIHCFNSNPDYGVDFLADEGQKSDQNYLGTLTVG